MYDTKYKAFEVAKLMNGTLRKRMLEYEDLIGWDEPPNPMFRHGWTDQELEPDELWIWMQSIGLQDKNGTDIYFDDIVSCNGSIGLIKQNPYELIIEWKGRKGIDYSLYPFHKMGKLEVIGNKWTTPELWE